MILQSRKEEVAVFTLSDHPNKLELKSGHHAVCLIDVGFFDDNGKSIVMLKSENGKTIKINGVYLNPRFIRNNRTVFEFWNFYIEEAGIYELTFQNLNDMIAKKSMLPLSALLQSKIDPESIKVLIREVVPLRSRIFSLFALIIGGLAMAWGIGIGLLIYLHENPN